MTTRRRFLKYAAATGAASGAGMVFAKVAHSYDTYNYLLSQNGKAGTVFGNFEALNIAQNASPSLPPDTNAAVREIVGRVQQDFIDRAFTAAETPFSQRLGLLNAPLWGRERTETVGPNPGFGTVQSRRNVPSPIAFSGSTTGGIDVSMQILAADENFNALDLDGLLIPVREGFADWGTWAGDVNPQTGQPTGGISATTYETRMGSVLRNYEVIEPGSGGFGMITLMADSYRNQYTFRVRVGFA